MEGICAYCGSVCSESIGAIHVVKMEVEVLHPESSLISVGAEPISTKQTTETLEDMWFCEGSHLGLYLREQEWRRQIEPIYNK